MQRKLAASRVRKVARKRACITVNSVCDCFLRADQGPREMSDFLLLAFIVLCAGAVAVPIATRLGLGSVLGYLLAGIAISPILGLLHVDILAIRQFGELGVVLMLFLVGLELEPKAFWRMRTRLVGMGGAQVLASAGIIMIGVMMLGQSWAIALSVGLILALSSTAIVLQTLTEKGLIKSDGGQASFAVLLFQDIAVIPMLALLPLLAMPDLVPSAVGGDHGHGGSLITHLNGWQRTLVTLAAVATVILGGNYLSRPIFRFVSSARLRELFTAAALTIVIGIALLMTFVGLSPALGTFLAGVVLANSEYRHELQSDIDPFRGLLLGLFFVTVGAGINFPLLGQHWPEILGLTTGLILIKLLVLLGLARIFQLRNAQGWLFALALAQAGEFGFVLVAFTLNNGILPEAIADRLSLVVALSMFITPALFILYDRIIAPKFAKSQAQEADNIEENNEIILAGHGRMGGIIDRILQSAGYRATVIDYSSKRLDVMRTFGVSHAYFGDATRPDLLHAAGIRSARLLIVAIDGRESINAVVEYAMRNFPDLHVVARAVDRDHVYELWARGCRDIIRETYDSSLRIGRSALEALGVSRPAADAITHAFNEMDRQSMIEVADVFDITIPAYENAAYVEKVRTLREPWQQELRNRVGEILAADRSGVQK